MTWGVTTINESHPRHVLAIPADPGSGSGTGAKIQTDSLDTGVRRYDGWTFIGIEFFCHCERNEAISCEPEMRLLRRSAPRNDRGGPRCKDRGGPRCKDKAVAPVMGTEAFLLEACGKELEPGLVGFRELQSFRAFTLRIHGPLQTFNGNLFRGDAVQIGDEPGGFDKGRFRRIDL